MSRTLLRVVVIALLLTGLLLLVLPPAPDDATRRALLPWSVAPDGRGGSIAFGLALGEATLADAEARLGEAEVTLFRRADGTLAVEAFLDDVRPAGLLADFVLTIDLPQAALSPMYERGLRIARGTEGVSRVDLDPADLPAVRAAPVAAITYLPAVDLDPEVVETRFGEPRTRVNEADGVVHWLYPEKGVDVVVRDDGKEVLQYVAPRDFGRLRGPLAESPDNDWPAE
ncbi:MAG: hypothetical protein R3298_03485 [Gammaproteobacteria bacterium]|nr:hypothetical protein [Gammaproteobacteria bacterium]